MIARETLKKHASLMDRMATSQGIDLQEAAMRAQLTPSDVSDAVLSCTNCTNPDDCAKWLDTAQGTEDKPPGYCRNTALFAALSET